jgi:hypothetical protein
MNTHALNPSGVYALPPATVAVALIGHALIQYRINHSPEQKARLQALAEMAIALGALSRADWQHALGGV